MIIMKSDAKVEEISEVVSEIRKCGLRADISRENYHTVIGLIGDESRVPFEYFTTLPGVQEAGTVESPYRLISREYRKHSSSKQASPKVQVGEVEIGGAQPVVIAGPCAVESREQLLRIAAEVKQAGADILRGGIFKPRSSVHSFQGLGSTGDQAAKEALTWLRQAGERFGLATVTEVRGEAQVELAAEHVDMLQIGTRNMYNQDLLTRVARTGKPVLFKRHFGAGIQEFLSYAEYIAAEGNKNIVLCERGILPIGKGKQYARYTLDLTAVPIIKQETCLPVIVDPSHATGRRDLVFEMSCAAVAAGANGLMIETHYNPSEALVDAQQTVTPDELDGIVATCRKIGKLVSPERR